jgi:hypothetical protein
VCESELTLTLLSTPHHPREYTAVEEEAIALLDPTNSSDPYLSSVLFAIVVMMMMTITLYPHLPAAARARLS